MNLRELGATVRFLFVTRSSDEAGAMAVEYGLVEERGSIVTRVALLDANLDSAIIYYFVGPVNVGAAS